MTRLIDAKKLIRAILNFPDCENGYSDAYDKECIISEVEAQPTVDAVPVEFIEKHVQIAKECDDPIASYHMDWIVAQWRIENGQTD